MQILKWNNAITTFCGAMASMVAVLLLFAASDSLAATSQPTGRDFNHMETGFPLTGAHATEDCATCHAGGIFKGTPKNCDGCHALGRRVVATPKSSHHIPTNDPCEVCHTNTVTFLGVKFNHATVTPGSCTTCHNGSIVQGRPASHNAGNKLTQSCDSCHRTTAWLPASWNHTGITADCGTCHVVGGQAASYVPVSPIHSILPSLVAYGPTLNKCTSCHRNYFSFLAQSYDHVGVGACNTCHSSAYAQYGILAMPSNHIPVNSTAKCSDCHYSPNSWTTERMGHNPIDIALTPCTTCHLSSSPYAGTMQKVSSSHLQGKPDCISCHTQRYDQWSGAGG